MIGVFIGRFVPFSGIGEGALCRELETAVTIRMILSTALIPEDVPTARLDGQEVRSQ